jgi:hypothetical protein
VSKLAEVVFELIVRFNVSVCRQPDAFIDVELYAPEAR